MSDRTTPLAIIALAVLAGILTAGVVTLLVVEAVLGRPLTVPEPLPTILGVAYTAMFSGALFFGHTAAQQAATDSHTAAMATQGQTFANLAQQIATTTMPAVPGVTTSSEGPAGEQLPPPPPAVAPSA